MLRHLIEHITGVYQKKLDLFFCIELAKVCKIDPTVFLVESLVKYIDEKDVTDRVESYFKFKNVPHTVKAVFEAVPHVESKE